MNMQDIVGREDILFITFDTLRYDVAQRAWQSGQIPNLAKLLPASGWEMRHTPGSFTYAAHAAFFAGFLPTPVTPGVHGRLFAVDFPGSETITHETYVFSADNIVTGLQQVGYHTVCVGGVGFFNRLSPLGKVFPSLFRESYWSPELGVTEPNSTAFQVRVACAAIAKLPPEQRLFLFINLSALHQPNRYYFPEATEDSCATQQAALEYGDRELPPLFEALRKRSAGLGILCSDHGTAYGEEGYQGHRLAHPVVWNVPYAEVRWEKCG